MSSPPTMGIGTSSSSSGAPAPRANAYTVNRDASELRRSPAWKAPASDQPGPMDVSYAAGKPSSSSFPACSTRSSGPVRRSCCAEQIGVRSQANVVSALTLPGRVLAALGASRHAEAFQIAERLFDPADPAYHPAMRCWLIGDLAEAAANTGRHDHALARVAEVEAAVGKHPETWVALELRYARAILATDPEVAAA